MRSDFLVYEAKSFYNAYIALEQLSKLDATSEFLLYVPMIVNGAFSIELTLKAILVKNNISYGKDHNLLSLFRLLPNQFQRELLTHLMEKAPEYVDTEKCVDEIVLLSNAFVDWRYAFEGNPAPAVDTRFLAAFANAAILTMFSHYNVDLVPSTKIVSDDEIEQKFHENRELCKKTNLQRIEKKNKERHS